MNTSIDELLDSFSDDTTATYEEQTTGTPIDIFNFALSQKDRMNAFHECYRTTPELVEDIVSKIKAIYNLSPVVLMKKFLYEVSSCVFLPLDMRIDCIQTLVQVELSSELGANCLNTLMDDILVSTIPTPRKMELVVLLIRHNFVDRVQTLFQLLNDTKLPVDYRYRYLLSVQHSVDKECMIRCSYSFMCCSTNPTSYRLLAAQNLLHNTTQDSEPSIRDTTYKFLMDTIHDTELDERIRADAVDIILRLGEEHYIRQAHTVLKELSGTGYTLYDNKENVHDEHIEKSVLDILLVLDSAKLQHSYSFDKVRKHIMDQATDSRNASRVDADSICSSLDRIEFDRASYINHHTLRSVLCIVYGIANEHPYRDQLLQRMLEELMDMCGTCSSGCMSRLVNVLSGFGIFDLSISWEKQIIANLNGRLNARLRMEEDCDTILDQMTNKELPDRIAFHTFFRKHIPSIKEEMYSEFREFMDDTDWDLYFRKAILAYQ